MINKNRAASANINPLEHARFANSVLRIPSDKNFILYPDNWTQFTIHLRKLLDKSLPPFTKCAFAAIQMHGLKHRQDDGRLQESLKQVSE